MGEQVNVNLHNKKKCKNMTQSNHSPGTVGAAGKVILLVSLLLVDASVLVGTKVLLETFIVVCASVPVEASAVAGALVLLPNSIVVGKSVPVEASVLAGPLVSVKE